MNLVRAYKMFRRISVEQKIAHESLAGHVVNCDPSLIDSYARWSLDLRNVSCSTMTSLFGLQLCNFEGEEMDNSRREITFFAGAAARVSDDLIDERTGEPERFYLLDKSGHNHFPNSDREKLFQSFHRGLERLLPKDFCEKFANLIRKYNQAQVAGQRLGLDISDEEVVRIKDDTGGYPTLLLYSMMFPSIVDPSLDLTPNYDSKERRLPNSKAGAIYNLGALASRIDDLYDLGRDRKEGLKSLATQGLTDWKSARGEVDYVEAGLKKFYSANRLSTLDDWRMQVSRFAAFINNVSLRLDELNKK